MRLKSLRVATLLRKGEPYCRRLSNVTLDATQGDVEDVLDRNIDKTGKSTDQEQPVLLTTSREALHLYRDILRATRLFVWKDEQGVSWKEVIRSSARKEFEASAGEKDPQMVTRMLLNGRDSLDQAIQKFMAKREEIIKKEQDGQPAGQQ